jgi:hypothetical protein
MSADVLHDDQTSGPRSISERAEDGDAGVPEQEMFPSGSLDGEGVTPQTYVRKGLPTELRVALSKAEVPLRGSGVPNPNQFGRAIITYLPGAQKALPVREDKNDPAKVTGHKVTVDLRVTHVADANDTAGLVRTEFEVLLAQEPNRAAALLDELRSMVTEALGEAA